MEISNFLAEWFLNPYEHGPYGSRGASATILAANNGGDSNFSAMVAQSFRLSIKSAKMDSDPADILLKKTATACLPAITLGALRYAFHKGGDTRERILETYRHEVDKEVLDSFGGDPLAVVKGAVACEAILEQELCGISQSISEVKRQIWAAALGQNLETAMRFGSYLKNQNVLILGPSGSGKEIAAQAIMAAQLSRDPRKDGKVHSLNVSALTPALMESELFGYVKGAFTDAKENKPGLIELSNDGPLFLDEIGDLPLPLQTKLLRVIESGEVRKVGGSDSKTVAVRYIAATHKDLSQMVLSGDFRHDLLYRLNGVTVTMPSLAEIPESDFGYILDKFLGQNRNLRGQVLEHIKEHYRGHRWPGNMRELKNVVSRYLLQGEQATQSLATFSNLGPAPNESSQFPKELRDCVWSLEEIKSWYIDEVLGKTKSNTEAAAKLGVCERTIARHIQRKEANG